jgi:hypothetical protein
MFTFAVLSIASRRVASMAVATEGCSLAGIAVADIHKSRGKRSRISIASVWAYSSKDWRGGWVVMVDLVKKLCIWVTWISVFSNSMIFAKLIWQYAYHCIGWIVLSAGHDTQEGMFFYYSINISGPYLLFKFEHSSPPNRWVPPYKKLIRSSPKLMTHRLTAASNSRRRVLWSRNWWMHWESLVLLTYWYGVHVERFLQPRSGFTERLIAVRKWEDNSNANYKYIAFHRV